MFGTIQNVINQTKEDYAAWEFQNSLGYVDHDIEITNRQKELLSVPNTLKYCIASIGYSTFLNQS